MSFSIEIASVPDRDALVAEIWFGGRMVAELQRISDSDFRIEIYDNKSEKSWSFKFHEWIAVLNEAKARLATGIR